MLGVQPSLVHYKRHSIVCSLGFRLECQQGFDGDGERDPAGAGGDGGGAAPVQRVAAAGPGGRQEERARHEAPGRTFAKSAPWREWCVCVRTKIVESTYVESCEKLHS